MANKLTFSAAVDRWAQAQLQARKDQGREALRGLRKDILNTLGELELPQLRKGELVACLDGIVARGSRRQANVALRELKQFFSWAEAREWIARSPLAGVDKAHVGGPEAERDRALSPAEIVLLRDQIARWQLDSPRPAAHRSHADGRKRRAWRRDRALPEPQRSAQGRAHLPERQAAEAPGTELVAIGDGLAAEQQEMD
ncbi:MAG: hypothetical protein KGL51_13755 [Betaproteobacteria bacterium]|nr:hypothetical protein [Betaproteobacteria bacterium]MDE2188062.1 hypothetical protein [Betaproteobacteria bacterium]MDE2325716.1 hypothetical protein [Betaproteobacteria bacterium]